MECSSQSQPDIYIHLIIVILLIAKLQIEKFKCVFLLLILHIFFKFKLRDMIAFKFQHGLLTKVQKAMIKIKEEVEEG